MEFELQELVKIALGGPELTNVSTAVLHSLLEILLKKLNCQNETVSLSSYESKMLQKLLEKSKTSPLAFNDESVECIEEKLKSLQRLQEVVNDMDKKLACHLEHAKWRNNFQETQLDWENWEHFGSEDLCTFCDADNDIACKLLKNTDFLKKLLRRISAPMVDRVFLLEDKLQSLQEEFNKFTTRAQEEYLKIQLLETCIYEIELLRKKLNENQTQFICTIEEVQDMLDAKLDKI
uniref:Uncharacterized protein n=1 Tax=Stomoxys calcitrans TaxID=35570 RepID=A0A1I8NYD4_STOCA